MKGDRQDSGNIFDMQLIPEYESDEPGPATIGAVQRVDGLRHEAMTVDCQAGAQFLNPAVFATPATLNGPQPVTTELVEIIGSSATLLPEEPDYLDGFHLPESVTLMTL
jgi:hypothetical protein